MAEEAEGDIRRPLTPNPSPAKGEGRRTRTFFREGAGGRGQGLSGGDKIPGGDETFIPGGVGILFSIGGKDPRRPWRADLAGRTQVRTLFLMGRDSNLMGGARGNELRERDATESNTSCTESDLWVGSLCFTRELTHRIS